VQVGLFVDQANDLPKGLGQVFVEAEIDGTALALITVAQMVQVLGVKPGPAIKLSARIEALKPEAAGGEAGTGH